jgi:hypothetical protein
MQSSSRCGSSRATLFSQARRAHAAPRRTRRRRAWRSWPDPPFQTLASKLSDLYDRQSHLTMTSRRSDPGPQRTSIRPRANQAILLEPASLMRGIVGQGVPRYVPALEKSSFSTTIPDRISESSSKGKPRRQLTCNSVRDFYLPRPDIAPSANRCCTEHVENSEASKGLLDS